MSITRAGFFKHMPGGGAVGLAALGAFGKSATSLSFHGGLGALHLLSGAETRSVSPENSIGDRGKVGRAVPNPKDPGLPITCSLAPIPHNAACFHAQWGRTVTDRKAPIHTLLDGVRGAGRYVGTFMAHTQLSGGWFGEGEMKFYIYRWHILDPIEFKKDLRITIQSLGWWNNPRRYQPLADDIATVAYWYQTEPHAPFPKFPALPERWPR